MDHFKSIDMYLTFEQALKKIKPKEPKNSNYANTRIIGLIKNGKLIEAKPDVYVKNNNGDFVMLKNILTSRLVTEDSVKSYVDNQREMIKLHGKLPKPNKRIKCVFYDETSTYFDSVMSAMRFFGVSRRKIQSSIDKRKPIDIPVHSCRKDEFISGVKTESVRFYEV